MISQFLMIFLPTGIMRLTCFFFFPLVPYDIPVYRHYEASLLFFSPHWFFPYPVSVCCYLEEWIFIRIFFSAKIQLSFILFLNYLLPIPKGPLHVVRCFFHSIYDISVIDFNVAHTGFLDNSFHKSYKFSTFSSSWHQCVWFVMFSTVILHEIILFECVSKLSA